MENLKTTKSQIEYILHTQPATRNCDKLLWEALINEFYEDKIFIHRGEKAIKFSDILVLPQQADVKRVRAMFQGAGKYLPTDAKVSARRFIPENAQLDYKKGLGY